MTLDGQIGLLVWTLEDQVREVPGADVPAWKIKSETAIPVGEYRIAITYSPKFKRRMPILLDVPGFEGIRIHSGNTATDTEGCILVGQTRAGQAIYESRIAFKKVYDKIETTLLAAEEVRILIRQS